MVVDRLDDYDRKNACLVLDFHNHFLKNNFMSVEDFVSILLIYYPNPSLLLKRIESAGVNIE